MSKIVSQIRRISHCSENEQMECYALMCKAFIGVKLDDFKKDFSEKDYVILLTGPENEIVGFSTLMIIDILVEGKTIKAIFSGDTTVEKIHRNSLGFAIEFAKFFSKTVSMFPDYEIYYVLISKGWRTYRILPFYFHRFIPHPDFVVSSKEQSIMDAFGEKKYPNNYNRSKGLLIFNGDVQRLIPGSIDAELPSRKDNYADFFFKKNPDYLSGNELVCIARVSVENFTPAISRLSSSTEEKEAPCKE